jgi:pantetheine-phosphate adenylyltransferase
MNAGVHATLGGTFDHLHAGHLALLAKAYEVGERVTIAVTSAPLTLHKAWADLVQPFADRRRAIEALVESREWASRTRINEFVDPRGAASYSPDYHAIVVTPETEPNARKMNGQRLMHGLPPLSITVVDWVLAGDGWPISSSRIRAGEVDTDGTLFLPPAPLGLESTAELESLLALSWSPGDVADDRRWITIGEQATRAVLDADGRPWIGLVGPKSQELEAAFDDIVSPTSTADAEWTALARRVLAESGRRTLWSAQEIPRLATLSLATMAPLQTRIAAATEDGGLSVIEVDLETKRSGRSALRHFVACG